MDLYSTVLWHLKRECELSHLAQEVQAIDRLSPQVRVDTYSHRLGQYHLCCLI